MRPNTLLPGGEKVFGFRYAKPLPSVCACKARVPSACVASMVSLPLLLVGVQCVLWALPSALDSKSSQNSIVEF